MVIIIFSLTESHYDTMQHINKNDMEIRGYINASQRMQQSINASNPEMIKSFMQETIADLSMQDYTKCLLLLRLDKTAQRNESVQQLV